MADFLARLGIQLPIVQAPMAGVSTPAMTAAVSNAGALGSIPTGTSSVSAVHQLIADVRTATNKPFNVNLFCHQPARPDAAGDAAWIDYLRPFFAEFGQTPPATLNDLFPSFQTNDDMLRLLLETRPPVISFHFGLPSADKLAALRSTGAVLLGCATSLSEAQLLEAAGIDAIVAQGVEAGGHRGLFEPEQGDAGLGTLPLTRLLVKQLRVPVIAAGGIMDGAGIAAVLRLGAVAAQMGTAFVACPESAADDTYRATLLRNPPPPTAITATISGRPARGLVNRFMLDVDRPGRPPIAAYSRAYDVSKGLIAAARQHGNATEFAAHWAGQGAPLARALPAAELVQVLATELQAAQA